MTVRRSALAAAAASALLAVSAAPAAALTVSTAVGAASVFGLFALNSVPQGIEILGGEVFQAEALSETVEGAADASFGGGGVVNGPAFEVSAFASAISGPPGGSASITAANSGFLTLENTTDATLLFEVLITLSEAGQIQASAFDPALDAGSAAFSLEVTLDGDPLAVAGDAVSAPPDIVELAGLFTTATGSLAPFATAELRAAIEVTAAASTAPAPGAEIPLPAAAPLLAAALGGFALLGRRRRAAGG
jgi:hypothetical protein